jgi:hypothetical protein
LIFSANFLIMRAEISFGRNYKLLSRDCEWLSIVQKRRDSAIFADVGYSKWQISRIIFLY